MAPIMQKSMEMVKLLLVFILLTLLFYAAIVWISGIMTDQPEPSGRSIMVHSPVEQDMQTVGDAKSRLLFYYWFGE